MSSAAHWLVLGTFASRERVLSTWGTRRLTRTRSICMLIEHKHLHRQRKGKKKEKVCSFRHVTFRGLKSHTVIKSRSCASVHQLATPPPPPPVPCFVLPIPLPMSSLCGRRSSSHFGLPKDRDRGKKKTTTLTLPSPATSTVFVPLRLLSN